MDFFTNKMAEPQTRENFAQNPSLSPLSRSSFSAADPDPGERPLAPTTVAVSAAADFSDVGIEDSDLIREPKRRKHCPSALENLDELTSASNSSFGFTFDTKFCGVSAEITPKFGSFNSIVSEMESTKKEKKEQRSVLDSASKTREDEEREESVNRGTEEEEGEEKEVADALLEAIEGGGLESVAD